MDKSSLERARRELSNEPLLNTGGDSYFPCGRKIDEKIGQTPSDQAEILTA